MSRTLTFFASTPGGRDVIAKFLKIDLKNRKSTADQLIDQLKVLEQTPIPALREARRLEHVEGEIFSFRFRTESHWVRLLVAFWPNDDNIVVLHPLIKQQNRIDRSDIKHAQKNLSVLKARN